MPSLGGKGGEPTSPGGARINHLVSAGQPSLRHVACFVGDLVPRARASSRAAGGWQDGARAGRVRGRLPPGGRVGRQARAGRGRG